MNRKNIYPNIYLVSLFLFLFLFLNVENAKAGFGSDCRPCHEKMGQLTSPHTDEDCKSCHNWAEIHANLCNRCHSSDIHETHRNGVKCNLCHNPPQNWSSSRAKIPYTGSDEEGALIIPPSKKCTYCHNINTGGKSLHEIHGSNLKNICSKCHITEMNKGSITIVMKNIGNAEQKPFADFSPLQELLRLFDEIAGIIASKFGV
ncbi:MAG TPA: hypothetical protein VER35_02185 [Candidatus Limnocylindrales bacterium]|nr:hypothetical protein [Candidatus Limnocylindrales bacterium]